MCQRICRHTVYVLQTYVAKDWRGARIGAIKVRVVVQVEADAVGGNVEHLDVAVENVGNDPAAPTLRFHPDTNVGPVQQNILVRHLHALMRKIKPK